MTSAWRRLPNYIRTFGTSHGIRLWWQIELRLRNSKGDPGTIRVVVPGWPHPVHLRRNSSDASIFWQVVVLQQYAIDNFSQAKPARELHSRLVRDGKSPVILDCGANIGLAALWLNHRFAGSRIICVEPEKSNLAVLHANTAPYPNIEVFAGGIWREPAWLQIENTRVGNASFRVSPATQQTPGAIRAYSIEELVRAADPDPLFAIKMDIEGSESEVFAGNIESWITQAAMIMIEIHDWLLPGQGTSRNLFRALGQYPYDVVLSGENMILFRLPADETPR